MCIARAVLHDGELSLDQVYDIARTMAPRSMAKEFKGTVKEILGTCVSVGCTVSGKDPRQLQKDVDSGVVKVPAK